MVFEFSTAQRVIFGPGCFAQAESCLQSLGRRPFVLTGSHPERHGSTLEKIAREGIRGVVSGEPDFEGIRALAQEGRKAGCDSVLAIGGGSVLDAGKAVAMLLSNGGDPLDYAEVIGLANPITKNALPFVAVPTTAGAGSEVTRNAVLRSRQHGVKVSLRSHGMLPAVALVDPELTLDLPRAVTAATGMDALSQVLEAFVCRRANPITDALCRDGLQRIARSLPVVCDTGRDLAARSDMALGALLGGMALANAGLGAVHGFAAPIGGCFEAPHGAVCAALLAPVMEANLYSGGESLRARYAEVARMLTGEEKASADDGVRWVRDLTRDLEIPGLRAYGVDASHLDFLCERAAAASSMRGNPVDLGPESLRRVLVAAL